MPIPGCRTVVPTHGIVASGDSVVPELRSCVRHRRHLETASGPCSSGRRRRCPRQGDPPLDLPDQATQAPRTRRRRRPPRPGPPPGDRPGRHRRRQAGRGRPHPGRDRRQRPQGRRALGADQRRASTASTRRRRRSARPRPGSRPPRRSRTGSRRCSPSVRCRSTRAPGNTTPLDAVDVKDISELSARRKYASAASNKDNSLVSELTQAREELATQKAQQETIKEQAQARARQPRVGEAGDRRREREAAAAPRFGQGRDREPARAEEGAGERRGRGSRRRRVARRRAVGRRRWRRRRHRREPRQLPGPDRCGRCRGQPPRSRSSAARTSTPPPAPTRSTARASSCGRTARPASGSPTTRAPSTARPSTSRATPCSPVT